MNQHELFALALGLTEPWYVSSIAFSPEQKTLEIGLDFRRGGTFPCPECSTAGCKAYDSEERQWRHLNFFEHQTILRARVPRVRCDQCGVRPVATPWARPGSGFTLLFEAFVLSLAVHMPGLGGPTSRLRRRHALPSHHGWLARCRRSGE